MKMEKLDSKQMPQVIGLGVVGVVVFGWAAFSFLGGMAPAASQGAAKPADAAKAGDGKPKIEVAQATVPGSGAPGAAGVPGAAGQPGDAGAPGAAPLAPGMPGVGGQFNPDPFKSPFKLKDNVPAPADKKPAASAGADKNPAPALPELGFQAPQWSPAGTGAAPAAAPAAPAPPARPDVLVTGVIAGEGVRDMATMKVGTEERILQVGDRVNDATPYKVRKIAPDGVVLAQGKDSFFVALGAKTPAAKVEVK